MQLIYRMQASYPWRCCLPHVNLPEPSRPIRTANGPCGSVQKEAICEASVGDTDW